MYQTSQEIYWERHKVAASAKARSIRELNRTQACVGVRDRGWGSRVEISTVGIDEISSRAQICVFSYSGTGKMSCSEIGGF